MPAQSKNAGGGGEPLEESLARALLCPHAAACRSITPNTDADSAVCNWCGQILDRAALLELFAGDRS